MYLAACTIVCAVPMPFFDNVMAFSFALFGLLFFGGALVPTITGIMLNSVPEHLRTSANSVAQVCYNSLGYLPAPIFYGFVAKLVGDPHSKVPFIALLSTSLVTITMLVLAVKAKLALEEPRKPECGGTGEMSEDCN